MLELIYFIEMYPIETPIELNTGEVTIVLEEHEGEKLNPKIAILASNSQLVLDKP